MKSLNGFWFVLALIGSLFALFLTSCTQSTSSSSSPAAAGKPPAPATAAPAPTTTPPAPAPAQVIQLKYSCPYNPGDPYADSAKEWLDYIQKQTNNHVNITPYWGGTLISGTKVIDELRKGVADIALGSVFTETGYEIAWSFPSFILNSPSPEVTNRVSREIFEKYPQYQQEFNGLIVMGFRNVSPNILFTQNPIQKLDDLKGLSINSGSPGDTLFPSYGASITKIPPPEWYTSLQKGTVKANFIQLNTLKGYRLAEVIKYVNLDIQAPSAGIPMTFFNAQSFNSLPADIQKVFMDSRTYLNETQMKHWAADAQGGTDFAKQQGVQFVNLPPAEKDKWLQTLSNASALAVKRVEAVGKPGTEILNESQKLIQQYSK